MADRDLPPALPGLPALELRLIRPEKRPRFGALLCAQHYLRNATLVDATLRYVGVAPDGGWLALLGWSSAALHLRARDRWIGWSEPQRAARLRLIAQNSRFLILAERAHYPNLASHLLARCTRRLADDWRAAHGHTVVLAESSVDPALYEGTCYKAAGWLALGATGGFARDHRDFYVDLEHPKQLWVAPTDPCATNFVGAAQLLRIKRHVRKGAAVAPTITVVFGVTGRAAAEATPAQLLAAMREHWAPIENGRHHRRDRTYREDNSPVRDPNATPCYAALRCLAIFLCVQRKSAGPRPQEYHLPDFLRRTGNRKTTVIRWFTHAYRPP